MKKVITYFLISALTLCMLSAFSGCNKKTNEDEADEDEVYGELYTLQEAYDNGYISRQDLLSIAYYNNSGIPKENEGQWGEPSGTWSVSIY